MALHWPTFFTRLGSAVVFCAIMIVGLLWNEWTFVALVSLIQVLCIREYFRLMKKVYAQYYWPMWLQFAMQLGCLANLLYASALFYEYNVIFQIFTVLPSLVFTAALLSVQKARYAAGYALAGYFYICLPMLLLTELYMWDDLLPLMIILMIWCNDTLAYLVGSFIGKTPFSKISPKKTWEGTGGGVVLTLVSVGIWAYFKETNYSIGVWVGLALVVAVMGTLGDLLESKLKRMADVKDSGAMMPGHGGALDRFDSLLIATPFAFVYAYVFMF
ncbi:MAG TPA: phosphatidate cytidylyltransferase [Flavipsychrobacter sp.]